MDNAGYLMDSKQVNIYAILMSQKIKAEKECKYWIDTEKFDINEAYSYNMNNKHKRQVKKIIFEYFEFIENEGDKLQKEKG